MLLSLSSKFTTLVMVVLCQTAQIGSRESPDGDSEGSVGVAASVPVTTRISPDGVAKTISILGLADGAAIAGESPDGNTVL